jgi:hypothetical protein
MFVCTAHHREILANSATATAAQLCDIRATLSTCTIRTRQVFRLFEGERISYALMGGIAITATLDEVLKSRDAS